MYRLFALVVLVVVNQPEVSERRNAAECRLPKPEPRVSPHDRRGGHALRIDELSEYPLRGHEVRELFEFVDRGGTVCPADLLQREGMPFRAAGH